MKKTTLLLALPALLLSAALAEDIPINSTTCDITYSASHGTYPGTHAFDGAVTSGGRWLANKSADAYVQAHFKNDATYTPTNYTVVGLTGQVRTTRVVKEFYLKASTDGVNWDTIDHQTDQTNWADAEARTFPLFCNGAYSWFRFEMPDNNGAGDYTGICELIIRYDGSALSPAQIVSPTDGSTDVSCYPDMAWLCQTGDASFNVYLGSSQDLTSTDLLVQTADLTAIPSFVLEPGTTYYWRIDVEKDGTVLAGDTASFTTRQRPSGLVAIERFEKYEPGTVLAGQGTAADGWASAWLAPGGSASAVVTNVALNYDGGKVHIRGKRQSVLISGKSTQNADGALRRNLEPQSDSPLYMSFLVQPSESGAQMFEVLFQTASYSHAVRGVGADVGWSGGKISAVSNTTDAFRTGTSTSVEGGETYFVVCRVTRKIYNGQTHPYSVSEVLVNPTTLEEPATGWTRQEQAKNAVKSIDRFFVRTDQFSGGNTFLFDELRIGHDWASVVPETPLETVVFFR